MYIINRAITRTYWEPSRDVIVSTMLTRGFSVVRSIKSECGMDRIIRVHVDKFSIVYVLINSDTLDIGGWLYLIRTPRWVAYEVQQTFLFKHCRGQGLGPMLYKAAIDSDGLLLASGCSHTKFSRAMWKNFIKKKTFKIWAHDFLRLDKHSHVSIDEDDQFECDLDIYTKNPMLTDVRFIAEKR